MPAIRLSRRPAPRWLATILPVLLIAYGVLRNIPVALQLAP